MYLVQLVLAGNTVHMDYAFLRRHMPRLHAALSFRLVDVSSFNEISRRWVPNKLAAMPKKERSHRALDDIWESVDELRFYRKHMFDINDSKVPERYLRQGDGTYIKKIMR
jgi:oligoribonuclease